jgi:hypothetical protein
MDEHILYELRRPGRVAREPQAQREDPARVRAVQRLERRLVPRLGAADEVVYRRRHERWHMGEMPDGRPGFETPGYGTRVAV